MGVNQLTGEPPSPLGPLIVSASAEGYHRHGYGKPNPYHGYIYGVLKEQGIHAPGGARSYMEDGKMTGGFAVLAYPASYLSSGVMTFMAGQDGVVYQKDLGREPAGFAASIKACVCHVAQSARLQCIHSSGRV